MSVKFWKTRAEAWYVRTSVPIFSRFFQDGVCSPEDVDTVMSKGLGLRYSFMGPFETMHLNAGGQWNSLRSFRTYISKISTMIYSQCLFQYTDVFKSD
jgi:3-hydroxyacyl-CoA dehydrogenase